MHEARLLRAADGRRLSGWRRGHMGRPPPALRRPGDSRPPLHHILSIHARDWWERNQINGRRGTVGRLEKCRRRRIREPLRGRRKADRRPVPGGNTARTLIIIGADP
jgi:hypothetical protein